MCRWGYSSPFIVMMAAPPYRVADNRLWFREEELLDGALWQLERFADVLNAAQPRDEDLSPTLRALMGLTRDCSYGAGPRLLNDGTALRVLTKQKVPGANAKRRRDEE